MLLQAAPSPELLDACGASPSWLCRRVFDATGNKGLAGAVDYLVGAPVRILVILVVAFIASRLVRRAIRRFTESITSGAATARVPIETSVRAASRARTIGSVLRSLSTAVIYGIAFITILGELDISLGPLIASAGIAGVAVGFGAQSLVRDFLAGMFMLVEDQYGVGDIIDVGEASGVVEAVGLRTTKLRDVNGTVWYVPNGQIARVGNLSQQWARALIDVSVSYDTDLRRAESVIKQVADGMWHDPEWRNRLLEEPELWGVENLGSDGIDIRIVIKTKPSEQFQVMRELRTRLKETFDREGIQFPALRRIIWTRDDKAGAGDPAAGVDEPAGPPGSGEGHLDA